MCYCPLADARLVPLVKLKAGILPRWRLRALQIAGGCAMRAAGCWLRIAAVGYRLSAVGCRFWGVAHRSFLVRVPFP
eukprot:6803313-Prymnesium_polylepis.1